MMRRCVSIPFGRAAHTHVLYTKGARMTQSRRMLVLRAVVEDYIRSQEPVGSTTLTRDHDLGVSSATVRNDMAALEDEGYLIQPHTSAGRIPTEKGYRYFGQPSGHVAACRTSAGTDHRAGGRGRRAVVVQIDATAC